MKKHIFRIFSLILFIGALIFIGVYIYFDDALTPNPTYNTEYNSTYSENKFNTILIGDNYEKVLGVLGEPLSRDTVLQKEIYLYSNAPDLITLREGASRFVTTSGSFDSLHYFLISFNKLGIIEEFNPSNSFDKINYDEISSFSKEQIKENFGAPQIEMRCHCDCEVLSYSMLKEGPYKGKHPVTTLRKIVISNNEVKLKVSKEGNPYNPYVGLCSIRRN